MSMESWILHFITIRYRIHRFQSYSSIVISILTKSGRVIVHIQCALVNGRLSFTTHGISKQHSFSVQPCHFSCPLPFGRKVESTRILIGPRFPNHKRHLWCVTIRDEHICSHSSLSTSAPQDSWRCSRDSGDSSRILSTQRSSHFSAHCINKWRWFYGFEVMIRSVSKPAAKRTCALCTDSLWECERHSLKMCPPSKMDSCIQPCTQNGQRTCGPCAISSNCMLHSPLCGFFLTAWFLVAL